MLILSLPVPALASSGIVSADSFATCSGSTDYLIITSFSFRFSQGDKSITFDIAGQSFTSTTATAQINVTAYGIQAYSKIFDPCSPQYNITQLCPLMIGGFGTTGQVAVPEAILNDIPSIAFQIPDLDGTVTLALLFPNGSSITCLQASISNGRSLASSSIRAISAAFAGGTLITSGAVSLAASISPLLVSPGLTSVPISNVLTSPNVADIFLWYQALASFGMLSLVQPKILQSFYTNFGWSMGLFAWNSLQTQIDQFRNNTGGNLTDSSLKSLEKTTPMNAASSGHVASILTRYTRSRRKRDQGVAPNSTASNQSPSVLGGIGSFVEQLRVPTRNTFTTVLIVSCIILTGVLVLTIVCRVILVLWVKLGSLPRKLDGFHKHYWTFVKGWLLRLLLILYGTWCIVCLYQFDVGDSWAATLLAATTLTTFTVMIAHLSVQIIKLARNSKQSRPGGVELLYTKKMYLDSYGAFYDQYKSQFWWFFIPCTVYSISKALFLVFGTNHALIQIVGGLVVECTFLFLLLKTRAYTCRRANILSTTISVVRILSLGLTLLFIETLGLKETTKAVLSVVVIIMQTGLTVLLAFLVMLNMILPLIKMKTKTKKKDGQNPRGYLEENVTSESSVPLNEWRHFGHSSPRDSSSLPRSSSVSSVCK